MELKYVYKGLAAVAVAVLQSDRVELKYVYKGLAAVAVAVLQSDRVELKCGQAHEVQRQVLGFNRTGWN